VLSVLINGHLAERKSGFSQIANALSEALIEPIPLRYPPNFLKSAPFKSRLGSLLPQGNSLVAICQHIGAVQCGPSSTMPFLAQFREHLPYTATADKEDVYAAWQSRNEEPA
jgi:hypothetical protein